MNHPKMQDGSFFYQIIIYPASKRLFGFYLWNLLLVIFLTFEAQKPKFSGAK